MSAKIQATSHRRIVKAKRQLKQRNVVNDIINSIVKDNDDNTLSVQHNDTTKSNSSYLSNLAAPTKNKSVESIKELVSKKKNIGKFKNHKNFAQIDETSPPEILGEIDTTLGSSYKENITPKIVNASKQKKRKSRIEPEIVEDNNLLNIHNSSNAGNPTKKRRTYELDTTVNQLDDLITASPFQISTNNFDITEKQTSKNKSNSIIDLSESVIDLTKKTPRKSNRSCVRLSSDDNLQSPGCSKLLQGDEVMEDKTKFLYSNFNDSHDTTFRLENSTIDINTLKDASRNELRIAVLSSNHQKKSKINTSKVTFKRQKNENTDLSPFKQIAAVAPFFSASTPYPPSDSTKITRKSINRSLSTPILPSTSNLGNKPSPKSSLVKKVPNFALIHQRAMEKLESISEYKKRKETRANLLLTGKKPSQKKTDSKKKPKRELRFAPNTIERAKAPDFIPLPSTPMPKKKPLLPSPLLVEPIVTRSKAANMKFKLNDESICNELEITNPFEFKARNLEKSKSPQESGANKPRSTPKAIYSLQVKNLKFANSSRAQNNSKIISKPFQFTASNIFSQKANSPKVLGNNHGKPNTQEGFNRFGFKVRERKEMLKTLVSKNKPPIKDAREKRELIKGVRSNRRFELWMKMRNI